MSQKKIKEKRKKPKVMIDIHIQVLSTGEIKIDAPKNLDIFHEVITQAERVMIENYGDKKKENKVIELEPRIILSRN